MMKDKQIAKLKDLAVNYKLMSITKDEGVRNTCRIKIADLESEISALDSLEEGKAVMVTDQEITDYFILNAHEFVNNGYTVTRCMDRYHAIEMVKHFHSRLSEPSMPEREELTLFEFLYNSDTNESCAGTMSIHSTRKGAEMAMEFHKESKRKEHLDQIKWERENSPKDFPIDETFGKWEYWGINEVKVQP